MKLKKYGLLSIIIMLLWLYFGPIEKILADDSMVDFDKTLNVNEETKIIKYLPLNTTVSSLLKKTSLKQSDTNSYIYDKTNNIKASGDIATGDRLVLVDGNNNIIKEYSLSVYGDVNGDGELDETDVIKLFNYYKKNEELDTENIESGNAKIDGGYKIILNNSIITKIDDEDIEETKEIDYGIFPKEESKITLADIAKLYQYSKKTIASLDQTNLSSSDESVATYENGELKIFKYGTVNLINDSESVDTATIKIIPNVNYIKVNKLTPKKYKDNIQFRLPNNSRILIMQDFDIMNLGSDNEQYYFSLGYNSGVTFQTSISSDLNKELRTGVIYKLTPSQLGDPRSGSIMYVSNAGQGQWIVKEPSGSYFWTAGNSGLICSGKACDYDEDNHAYSCSDGNQCTWWGGNNANVTRYKFAKNSYGDTVTDDKYYNFGTIKQKRIDVFMAADWKNDLIATFSRANSSKVNATIYRASDFINGKKTILYEFRLTTNKSIPSMAIQGYAISGGYVYRLRGNLDTDLYIEVIDMNGNYIMTQKIDPGYGAYGQESEGIKVYNNKLYFGIFYYTSSNSSPKAAIFRMG